MFGLYLNLRDRLTHCYTINNETLSFTALMIQKSTNTKFALFHINYSYSFQHSYF